MRLILKETILKIKEKIELAKAPHRKSAQAENKFPPLSGLLKLVFPKSPLKIEDSNLNYKVFSLILRSVYNRHLNLSQRKIR